MYACFRYKGYENISHSLAPSHKRGKVPPCGRVRVRGFLIKNMKNTVKITEVLRNHNFLKLWIGQIVSALGDRFHQMALLGLIMKKGGNVGEELSKITFWRVLPFFLFSLFSGVLSDRWSRKSILIGSDIVRVLFVLSDIKEGMKYMYHDARLMILISFGAIFWLVGISFYVAISDFAGKIWGFTSLTPLGLIFTLLGGGLLAGAVMVGKYGDWVKRNILYTGSIWILACGIMAFALVESYMAASGIIFFIGIAGGAFLAPINADIQKIVPDELRGRTFACKDIFVNAAMVTPVLLIGKLTTFISVRELMFYLGVGIFLIGIFVAWKSIKLNTIAQHSRNPNRISKQQNQ